MATNPLDVLRETAELFREGKYAESLERHLWLFHHSLEYKPAFASARISFVFGSWAELAQCYPPAREALVELRDRNVEAVLAGDTSFSRFQELAAMNQFLPDEAVTGRVFMALRHSHPEIADRRYDLAEKGLVACREYEVCSSYIPDANARFRWIRSTRQFLLDSNPDPNPEGADKYREVVDARFADDILLLIEILLAVGRMTEAEHVRERALVETQSEAARMRIRDAGIQPGE